MTFRPKIHATVFALSATVHSVTSWSYGGGGGGSSGCQEPQFFSESPTNNSLVATFSDFAFIASDADAAALTVKVNGTPIAPTITPIPNGDLKVAIHLANPIATPGKVQIAIDAKSKDGCFGFKPYYIEVK